VALTAAERQQRRRDKLAAERPAPDQMAPIEDRYTRQEAWDDACDTLQMLIEDYRTWRATTPAPAAALRVQDLPRLAAQTLTLAMISFPHPFGQDWHFPEAPPLSKAGTGIDNRTLREQLFAADAAEPDRDNFPRSAEDDATAKAWWARLPPDARATWKNVARASDPLDVWYILKDVLKSIR
jgi:hypothetical protein